MMRVAGLWRYPVKSMMGEALTSVEVGADGLRGDRRLALVEQATGLVASAKHPSRWGRLLQCRATLSDGAVTITLPSATVCSDDSDADEVLSAFAGRPVSLSAMPPTDPHLARHWPEVAGLAPPEVVAQREQVTPMGAGAPGTFFDYAPLHIVTTSSLAALRASGADAFSAARFRPNLLLDTPEEGFVEHGWLDRRVRLGDEVVLEVIKDTPRCAVPSLAQRDLPASPDVLRTVVARNRVDVDGRVFGCLGVYARVVSGGTVRVGDDAGLD